MIANLLLYFLVTITTFGSYSSQTAIPVIGERLEADVIAILSLVLILSLIVAPIVASYMIYFQEKPLILLGLSGVFVGLVVFAFSEFYTGITFYVVAFLSLFAINAGAITFLIPSILYIFSADIEKNLRYFPYIEFAWDLGYTFGGVMPLFVSEDIYFIMYFIPIAATILISFLILLSFLKQRPKNDNFNAEITLKKVLSEKEIFMDALVIVYVVASTRSIDPIFSGLVEDQEGDEEDASNL